MGLVQPGPVGRRQLAVDASGLKSETWTRATRASASTLTAQKINGALVGFYAGDKITNLHCVMEVAGVGAGYARMGLYSTAGSQLAISNDANATFIGSTGPLTVPLAAPYTILANGAYYICVLTNHATSQPQLSRAATTAGLANAIGSGVPEAVSQASQASFPATATFAVDNQWIWFGAS